MIRGFGNVGINVLFISSFEPLYIVLEIMGLI